MIEKFLSLSHVKKQVILALLDAFIICLVALISLSIYSTASNFIDNYILLIFISPLLAVSIFIYYGLYREIIRYMGFDSLWIIF